MPMPMDNDYTEHFVGFDLDGDKQCAVEQMCQFIVHLFRDICGSVKLSGSNFDDLRYDALKRANKNQLCLWLETLMLKNLSQTAERVEELKEEKVSEGG